MKEEKNREEIEKIVIAELVNNLNKTTDEELLMELESDGKNLKDEANKVRLIIEKAKIRAGKIRYRKYQKLVEQEMPTTGSDEIQIVSNLDEYLSDPEIVQELTIAARNGVELTNEERISIIKDILKLRQLNEKNEN